MIEIRNYSTSGLVAKAAAENAVELLNLAIEQHGRAVWVLAGGTSPLAAYKELISHYADAVDWSKVVILIGDERYVPLNHPDSNWHSIMNLFATEASFETLQRLSPDIQASVEATAASYEIKIRQYGIERFDLVWLGVGDDGHTLSLFPGSAGFTNETQDWVIPVHDSPKPPSERISLSLKALEYVVELVIFATGAAKFEALREARLKGELPIAVAASTVESSGGEVRWLYDDDAWGSRTSSKR